MNPEELEPTLRCIASLDAGEVVRYHACPTVHKQTVGHHTWGVGVIAFYLTAGKPSGALLSHILLHDTPEIVTGDIPYTVKRDSPKIKEALKVLEDVAYRSLLLQASQKLSDEEQAILKIADTLEGLRWTHLHERARTVNDRWTEAYARARKKFSSSVDPEVLSRADAFAQLYASKHEDTNPTSGEDR